jgi:hypothetical protein
MVLGGEVVNGEWSIVNVKHRLRRGDALLN